MNWQNLYAAFPGSLGTEGENSFEIMPVKTVYENIFVFLFSQEISTCNDYNIYLRFSVLITTINIIAFQQKINNERITATFIQSNNFAGGLKESTST